MVVQTKYVTPMGFRWIKFKNSVFNRLFPFPPFVYAGCVGGLAAVIRFRPDWAISWPARTFEQKFFSHSSQLSLLLSAFLSSSLLCYGAVWWVRWFYRNVVFAYRGWLFETRDNVSTKTKIWMIFVKMISFAVPKTHSYDSGLLPIMPLPKLKDTISRWLISMRPVLTDEEYEEHKQLAEDFLVNEGPQLQRYLWLKTWIRSNYVTDWWTRGAYLMQREPIIITSNVANVDLFVGKKARQAARAANVLYFDTIHMLRMAYEEFRPLINSGVALTATWYDNTFGTCRIPGEELDELKHWDLPRHLAVHCNGCWYRLPLCDENGRVYKPPELEITFQSIIDRVPDPHPGEPELAALTLTDRTKWARNREKYLQTDANRDSLEIIESSLAVVFFSDDQPEYGVNEGPVYEAFVKSMLTSKGYERWPDKTINYVIGKNGRAGGTIEHSWGDGFEFDHLRENITYFDNIKQGYTDDGHTNGKPQVKPPVATRLQWELSDDCQLAIKESKAFAIAQADNLDLAALIFSSYGKGFVKKQKLSPDAYLHMAFQLAYFKDQGKTSMTYEAASGRFFRHGRTTNWRVVTKESKAFVAAMMDEKKSNAERISLFRLASEQHTLGNRMAMCGQGVDKHLFALYVLNRYFKKDSEFLKLAVPDHRWIVSTSQAPTVTNLINEDKDPGISWLGACFGPVDKDGYGICYRHAGDHSFCIHITSFKASGITSSARLRDNLRESLLEMQKIFD